MANFAPAGIVRIGRVPFDNSYAHTMTFANASSQASFFSSVCTQSLEEGSYTYVRMNNSIKVAFNAERLYTYNYIMYKNRNYGDKWFYAFITGVNYVNERTTELVVELDVMQTWYFDYRLEQCFVEREHVNDDTIGANLMPEPAMEANEISQVFFREPLGDPVAIVQTSAVPVDKNGVETFMAVDAVATESVSGGMYSKIVSNSVYYAFTIDTSGLTMLKNFMVAMNKAGGIDAVTAVFMVPRGLTNLPSGTLEGHKIASTFAIAKKYVSGKMPTSLNGYKPRNNKMLTYPYNYLKVMCGNDETTLKYELFKDTGYTLELEFPLTLQSTLYITPMDYSAAPRGASSPNEQYSLGVPFNVMGSYLYSPYLNWQAYNTAANYTALAKASVNTAFSLMGSSLSSADAAGSRMVNGKLVENDPTGTKGARSLLEAASAMTDLAFTFQEMQNKDTVARLQPQQSRGASSQSADFATGRLEPLVVQVQWQAQFAKAMDDYFSAYGYSVRRLKVPNRTGRRRWNYVKCANSDFHGNVPAEHMAMINRIYNAGITFWHTSDIGNYSRDNSII